MAYKRIGRKGYVCEKQPLLPQTQKPTANELERMMHRDDMSMIEILKMEHFLAGLSVKDIKYVPKAERNRIVVEYPIAYSPKETRYIGDLNAVWAVMVKKFPEATARYKNYRACQYALKYGATESCDWIPTKKEA